MDVSSEMGFSMKVMFEHFSLFSEGTCQILTSKSEESSYGNYLWYIAVWCFVGADRKLGE